MCYVDDLFVHGVFHTIDPGFSPEDSHLAFTCYYNVAYYNFIGFSDCVFLVLP